MMVWFWTFCLFEGKTIEMRRRRKNNRNEEVEVEERNKKNIEEGK